ncbi:glycosyltransferase family 2 protein [Halorussus salinus]|uniref:glycosyltransferase family 2 protein n=1 Tax=Halorussus salinus TaxID=1364935 RepID=UPI001093273D|nr:glycosyltransferase family 2 protein [Halorussus salinus]
MEEFEVQNDETLQRPAIGVVADESNADAIVRIVTLAREHGHEAIVAHGRETPRSARLARRLGAETVCLDERRADEGAFERLLTVTAKARGFPGLLFHPDTDSYVDYDQRVEGRESDSEYTRLAPTHRRGSVEETDTVVAIPAYDEADTIESLVRNVRKYVDTVVVVDDGSDDGTADLAREAGATVVAHSRNRGYGKALQSAFGEAHRLGADRLVIIDGDGQHDPSDVPELLAEFEDGDPDVVIGSRFVAGSETDFPLYRLFGLKVINLLTNLSFGFLRRESWISDTQCGFRAYGPRAIESIARDGAIGDNMGASTDILYHASERGYDVREVGTDVEYDVEDASSLHPVRHGLTIINNLLKTVERKRPVTVIGIPGFAVVLAGFGFGYLTLSNFTATDELSTGLVVLTVLLVMVGSGACLTAVILHSLATHFETIDDTT